MKAGIILLDDKSRYAMRAARLVRLGIDQQHIRHRAVGDVDLATVQNVVIAIEARGRCHGAKGIRAGTRLGQSERADGLARTQIGQVFPALRLIAISIDVIGAEIVMRHHGERERMVPTSEALRDQTG